MKRFSMAVAGLLVASTAASAAPWRGTGQPVTPDDLLPHLTGAEAASAKYTFDAWGTDGTRVYWSARFFNLGPGDGKCTVRASARVPGAGKASVQRKLDEDDYSVGARPLHLELDALELSGTPHRLRLRARGDGLSYDLTFEATAPPWTPGTLHYPEGRTYWTALVPPLARVRGTVTVRGKRVAFDGYGYGVVTRGDVEPHHQARRWIEARVMRPDLAIHLRHFVPPDDPPGSPGGYLVVVQGSKLVVARTDPALKPGRWRTDPKIADYRVPAAFIARAGKTGRQAVLGLRAQGAWERKDELAGLNMFVRAIVKRFAHPVRYSMAGQWELRLPDGSRLSGDDATYEVTVLNP